MSTGTGAQATLDAHPGWSNWFENESCSPERTARPQSEAEVQELVAWAASRNLTVRVAGAGHSVTPLVGTHGLLLDLSQMNGGMHVNRESRTATVAPGLRLNQLFDPLWDEGFAMRNVGEVATAFVAGAVSTGVHGTGVGLQCISAAVEAMRVVTADGSVIELNSSTPELLRAGRISLGMLGVVTQLTFALEPAYDLREHAPFMTVEETLDSWDELLAQHRHFSFYYLVNPASRKVFGHQIPSAPDQTGEICWALKRDPVDPAQPHEPLGPDERRDRWDRILTFDFDQPFREIEFAVPLDQAKSAFVGLRQLLQDRYPNSATPLDVRFTAPDDALLSPYHGEPKAIISVSTEVDEDWRSLLGDAEELLVSHRGLPHWGKLHNFDADQLRAGIPTMGRFIDIRRELDPNGVFLNPYLAALFE
jgi:FAD/FMN-containing dehydrogenase